MALNQNLQGDFSPRNTQPLSSTDLQHILTSTEDSVLHHIEATSTIADGDCIYGWSIDRIGKGQAKKPLAQEPWLEPLKKYADHLNLNAHQSGPFLLITTEILKDIDGTLNTIIKSPSKATKTAINHYIDIEQKPTLSHLTQQNYWTNAWIQASLKQQLPITLH